MPATEKESPNSAPVATPEHALESSQVDLPFVSQQPKVGDPPLSWEDFEKPRLRRFPGTRGDIRLRRYLGRGVDGLVIKARIKGRENPVAIKTFFFNHQPPRAGADPPELREVPPANPNSLLERHRRFHRPPKRPHLGAERYWAFERECMNCALLENIAACLERARVAGRQVLLNPKPKTRKEALANLRAIAAAGTGEDSTPLSGELAPFAPDVQITRCLGWTQFKGSDINKHLIKTRAECWLDLKDDEVYYANIYDYIPRAQVDLATLNRQLDFFHVTGFLNVTFNETNWLGPGVLVDFSDIISVFARHPWWQSHMYMVNQEESCQTEEGFRERSINLLEPIPSVPGTASQSHNTSETPERMSVKVTRVVGRPTGEWWKRDSNPVLQR